MCRVAREPDLDLQRDGAEQRERGRSAWSRTRRSARMRANRTPVGARRHRSREPREDHPEGVTTNHAVAATTARAHARPTLLGVHQRRSERHEQDDHGTRRSRRSRSARSHWRRRSRRSARTASSDEQGTKEFLVVCAIIAVAAADRLRSGRAAWTSARGGRRNGIDAVDPRPPHGGGVLVGSDADPRGRRCCCSAGPA